VGIAALTAKDRDDVEFAVAEGVDFIALSFVRSVADVRALRTLLEAQGTQGREIHVVAKIERRSAVERFDEILGEVDAVMVARGDLGIELPPQDVPLVQKKIIRKSNRVGVPVITATQMLQSMVDHPRPTRAESSDVANAILDGTDAVMLSAETATGRYPVEAVSTMREISRAVEGQMQSGDDVGTFADVAHVHPVTDAISNAAARIAGELDVKLIATTTWSGYTARQISRERPRQSIVALTPQLAVVRQLALVWGVAPVLVPSFESTDAMIETVTRTLLERGEVIRGDRILITGGLPTGGGGKTNFIKVHQI
jgi:pyruvate kinase